MDTGINGIKALLFVPFFYIILLIGIIGTVCLAIPGFICGALPIGICQCCSDRGVSD